MGVEEPAVAILSQVELPKVAFNGVVFCNMHPWRHKISANMPVTKRRLPDCQPTH